MKTKETRQFSAIADKIKQHGIMDSVIENFGHYYQKMLDQQHAMMPEDQYLSGHHPD
ncbi:MAG: hypothetical protein PF495_09615 [Spirochaetales bacterium]|nr:hypothetical protein [Spirochaetales bacterium]